MTSNFGWETVSNKKGSKNGKLPTKKDNLKKHGSEGMPRIEPAAPVKESPTIYQAFLEEELRKERKLLEAEKDNAKENKRPSSTTQKRRDRAHSLKECLTKIGIEEFETILKKDQISYPKCPDIWLRDIASFLNTQLDHIPDLDPIIANKPSDYPISEMSDEMIDYFNEKISSFSKEVNLSLLEYCIETLSTNVVKDQSSYGYRLFIQLLLHCKPELILDNLNKFELLLQRNTNRPIKALAILWSVGQIGVTSFESGVKVWFGVMFSLINVRNLNNYVIQYLETIFRTHDFHLPKESSKFISHDCVSKTAYFKYLGELYSGSSTLNHELKTRFKDLYPNIKKLAWGDASRNLNNFFAGYLTRCTTDCNESKKKELLECLVQCLQLDAQSFAVWRKEYQKNISQSCLLLDYISERGDELKLKKKLLNETIQAFQQTNEELTQKGTPESSTFATAGSKDLEYNIQICNKLSLKHKKSGMKWKYLLVVVLLPWLLLFSYDVHQHGSVHASLTYKTLAKAGVWDVSNNVAQKSKQYYDVASQWISDNSPNHLKKVSKYVSPYVESLKKQAGITSTFILDSTAHHREWLVEKFHLAVEQCVAYTPTMLKYLEWVGGYVVEITTALLRNILEALEFVYDYLNKNVFVGQLSPENLKKSFFEVVKLAQSSINSTVVWIKGTTFKK